MVARYSLGGGSTILTSDKFECRQSTDNSIMSRLSMGQKCTLNFRNGRFSCGATVHGVGPDRNTQELMTLDLRAERVSEVPLGRCSRRALLPVTKIKTRRREDGDPL